MLCPFPPNDGGLHNPPLFPLLPMMKETKCYAVWYCCWWWRRAAVMDYNWYLTASSIIPSPKHSYPQLSTIALHLPLITDLVFGRLLIPILTLLLWQRLEMPRNNLGNLTKFGLRICRLDIVSGGIRIQEEATLIALGSVGVLLLLLGSLLLLSLGCVGIVVAVILVVVVVGGRHVVFHTGHVTLLVLGGETVPMFALGGGDLLEFYGEDLGLERERERVADRSFSECEIAMGVS